MEIISPPYEAMSPTDILANDFLKFMETEGELIQIPKSTPLLSVGNCYWNAARVADELGGTVVHGWLVNIWSGSHIEAMHHAVWKTPDGQLVDITEGYSEAVTASTFLVDNRIPIDLHKMPNIPSRYFQITNNHLTEGFVTAVRESHSLESKKAELLYRVGYRCEAQFRIALGLQPEGLPDLSEPDMNALVNIAQQLQAAKEKIGNAIVALKAI